MRDIRDAHPHFDPDLDVDDELDRWEDDEGPDGRVPLAPQALDPPQRRSLARAIEAGLADGGCDTTLRRSEAWARQEEVPWGSLRRSLEEGGGFCDCEVLMNVLEAPD